MQMYDLGGGEGRGGYLVLSEMQVPLVEWFIIKDSEQVL